MGLNGKRRRRGIGAVAPAQSNIDAGLRRRFGVVRLIGRVAGASEVVSEDPGPRVVGAELAFGAFQRAAVERQRGLGVAEHLQAMRQIVQAQERVGMLRSEHAFGAFQCAAIEAS